MPLPKMIITSCQPAASSTPLVERVWQEAVDESTGTPSIDR